MRKVIDIFRELSSIPHCSYHTKQMRAYIEKFGKKYGYRVDIDSAKNILCSKNSAQIVLQSHYDMVCVGKAPKIEIVEEGGVMRADSSTLGADNGIGVAMMLSLMSSRVAAEFLFTNDEEVGLIGANAVELPLSASVMLNLDSEEEGNVYIGCAGGVELNVKMRPKLESIEGGKKIYSIKASGYAGGHSGVDIDKGIPNAIIELLQKIKSAEVVSIDGGERINSIAKNCEAIIASDEALSFNIENFSMKQLGRDKGYYSFTRGAIDALRAIPNGVIEMNDELGIPHSSINFSKISTNNGEIKFSLFLRAMDSETINQLSKNISSKLVDAGADVELVGHNSAWEPEVTPFSDRVKMACERHFKKVEYRAMHAGLECGVFKEKFPNLQIASIGPNIYYPHSTQEYVELDSVERVFTVVREIIEA